MRARLPLVLPAIVVLFGCAASESGTAAAWRTVVDTLGDTIVVRTIGAESPRRHGIVVETRIGELEGADEYTFGSITDVVVEPEGEIYVFDRQAMQLRRYDAEGRFVRAVGRKGAGPGEYDRVNGVDVGVDGRVYVWDAGNARIVMYDADGEPDGSFRVVSTLFTSNSLVVDSTDLVFTLAHIFGPDVTKWKPIVIRYGPGGSPVDTIEVPAYDLPSNSIVASSGGATASRNVPFSPARQWTLMPDMRFMSGRSDLYALHRELPGGRVLRIEREAPAVPVSGAERSEQEAFTTHLMRRTDPGWRWNGPPVPDVKPYFRTLRSGEDGRIWVQLSQPGELNPEADTVRQNPDAPPPMLHREPQVWDIFESDGRYIGQIELPFGFTLHVMRGDHVWGVMRDELDVQSVVRARIDPSLASVPSRDVSAR